MEENLKNRVILILVILTVIFFLGTLNSCGVSNKLKAALMEMDKQKASSWDTEQKINDLKNENASMEKQFQDLKAENEDIKKSFLQEQLVSQSLKEELEKVTRLKEALEDDLKDALVKGKPE
ncbi:MAG: hypothetical protein PHE18_07000 [Candidatus Omnitrophica bacterium]|nr:hypothetical protein [Candidatus Omnitrophota bacterium]MDD5553602.1 hypothetical protein [Candidatus Omnitrophota bacterium]